jgi:hypothetical protein
MDVGITNVVLGVDVGTKLWSRAVYNQMSVRAIVQQEKYVNMIMTALVFAVIDQLESVEFKLFLNKKLIFAVRPQDNPA